MMPPVKEPLAGLALLVIFGFLIWSNRPIQSSPSFDPYAQHETPRIIGNDAYEAWLWTDPFGFDPAAGSGGAFEAQKKWDQTVNETKSDKKSGDKAKKGQGKKPDPEHQDLTCQDVLKKIISRNKSLKILAPLVKVSPNTVENKELRTRQRYAVVAGLIESGYQPQQPDRLHFCSIQEGSREYDMRWEHYKYGPNDKTETESEKLGGASKVKPDIVVAWIDSEILTAEDKFPPGHKCTTSCNFPFKNLVKEVSKNNEFYLFDLNDILGQDRSKAIRDHIECIRTSRSDKRCVEKIRLIKPAGMEGGTGNQELGKKLAEELKLRGIKEPSEEVIIILEQGSENTATLAGNIQQSLGESFVKIKNVFYLKGSDGNPKKTGNQNKNENQSDDKPQRVSILDLNQPPPLPVGPGQMDYFHRLAEEIKNVHDAVEFKKRNSGAKAVVILGSDFNDKILIIEALREKMPHLLILTTDLDAQMLYPKHWRSTRNLVVASHFDLLLREKTKEDENEPAGRPFCQRAHQDQFPPFRDSHQTNIFYRTLAVTEGNASSIDESEKTFPHIFEVGRNGFVRLNTTQKNATEKGNDLDNRTLVRLVSALTFQNNAEKKSFLDYHPSDSTQENTKDRLKLLFGIALSLIGFHYSIRPRSGLLTTYLFVSTVGLFAVAYIFGIGVFDAHGSREPITFTDGISLWPVILIQIIAMLWAIALFFLTVCELDENFCGISWRYFQDCLKDLPVCEGNYGLSKCGQWLNKSHPLLKKWINRWQFNWRPWLGRLCSLNRPSLLVLLFLGVSVAVYALNDVRPLELSIGWCFGILVLLTISYICLFEAQDGVSIKRWREEDHRRQGEAGQAKDSPSACRILHWLRKPLHFDVIADKPLRRENYVSRLWLEYYNYGLLGHRVTRVVAIWLFFAIIETLLVYVLPPWPLPCRGSTTCGWTSWIGVLSFIIIMLLLFFILDAVRLNCFWIYKLRKQHPLLRERITPEHSAAYDQAARNYPAESLEKIVSLVAERTQAVDRLIYYPMFCIMLMLFAKITYFDNQDLPLSKALTFGVAISVLFFSGFMLRHEANQLKLSIKKRVQDLGKKYAEEKTAKQIVNRIDAIDEGAFQPMLEQPVMQALLIVLASIGLFAGEYLKLFG